MWSLYLLMNKLLNLEERDDDLSGENDSSSVEFCSATLSLAYGITNDGTLPSSHFIEVPHINQLYNWDCGLACVLMVLQTIGITCCDLDTLGQLCGTTSIWTVDLAYLLHNFSVNFSYLTVTLGANPNFSVETFYKEQLPNDLVRVDMLFRKALKSGIRIECRSINQKEIGLLMLSGQYIAIALVDQYKLSRSWLEDFCVASFYDSNLGYTGHYIVLCGYDADSNEFEIRDPASSRKSTMVSSKCLDNARKSFGTDEDLLLISLE